MGEWVGEWGSGRMRLEGDEVEAHVRDNWATGRAAVGGWVGCCERCISKVWCGGVAVAVCSVCQSLLFCGRTQGLGVGD